jgi:hypothetical protein
VGITPKSIKILWAAAGGHCSFPDCWNRLCIHDAAASAPHTIGEMAHIRGEKRGSNRYDPEQEPNQRDDYQNLILLCPTHHTLIDKKENEGVYSVAELHRMKDAHESKVLQLMVRPNSERTDIAKSILALLEENKQSWAQYGPLSELARRQPFNEAAFAVWESERLSVIVPNNRKICSILTDHQNQFVPNEQEAVAAFLTHSRSYEKWVADTIPYAAVVRFPASFDALIREIANASV